MNTELLFSFLKLLNVLFCLIIIAISLWHNAKKKIHTTTFIAITIGLLVLLILQSIETIEYETFSASLSLIIITIAMLRVFKISNKINNSNENTPSSDIIAQAKEQERSRIYANLHDDVGAKLLELIYTVKDAESKQLAKQVLNNIRQAVASTVNIQCNVIQLADEILDEAALRLKSANIDLIKSKTLSNPKQSLAITIPVVISRICREVISNVIKHSQATHVEITFNSTDAELNICIKDNGKGFSKKGTKGKGLKTINKRAQSISSMVEWDTQPNKGTLFSLVYKYGNH